MLNTLSTSNCDPTIPQKQHKKIVIHELSTMQAGFCIPHHLPSLFYNGSIVA
jgi:hypothetical protein